jgi:SAM-dependent methyltransferase
MQDGICLESIRGIAPRGQSMTRFDETWLKLREAADLRARDPGLLGEVAAALGASGGVVVDLGCGTGATFRALAPRLLAPVRWRLVDNDRTLLDSAMASIEGGAEAVQVDLARLDKLPLCGATFVTASALFDLCAASFIEALADRLAERRLGLYAALNYDGSITWSPRHGSDAAVAELFNRHQRSDKGMGQALGPDAGRELADTFTAFGYDVIRADSAWQLSEDMEALQAAFIAGVATAVGETGGMPARELGEWRAFRLKALKAGASCRVGHLDVLAQPPAARDR